MKAKDKNTKAQKLVLGASNVHAVLHCEGLSASVQIKQDLEKTQKNTNVEAPPEAWNHYTVRKSGRSHASTSKKLSL